MSKTELANITTELLQSRDFSKVDDLLTALMYKKRIVVRDYSEFETVCNCLEADCMKRGVEVEY